LTFLNQLVTLIDMSQSVPGRTREGSLWRDGNFLTMWGGQALSQFGSQITELALPVLAVLLLHATEAQVPAPGSTACASVTS
jgi:hypothetical protein